jgi:hypothetical protein
MTVNAIRLESSKIEQNASAMERTKKTLGVENLGITNDNRDNKDRTAKRPLIAAVICPEVKISRS